MIITYRNQKAVLVLQNAKTGKKESWLLTGYTKGDTDINFDLSQLTGPLFFKAN
ncbi:hypothetical protein AAFN88_12740 [Pelagibius sp. CAU 1746]|uniref:hypothetical protein n=1 Tax=Pelagibius sp. CAU 1746 TaxID=3140370 RepID=UPI00325BE12D